MSTHAPRPSRRALLAAVPALGAFGVGASAQAATAPQAVGVDGALSVAYVEVNDNDLVHVGDYVLSTTGAPAFDVAVIFAANIRRDGDTADGALYLNERVQWTLDNAETQIRPLQDAGIRVTLSILGDHTGVGIANLPDRASAARFAAQVADVVERYGLDGVDLDDEWAEYGKDGTAQPNDHSLVDLVEELRAALGEDRLITFYSIGPAHDHTVDGDRRAGDVIDYAWNPYYGSWYEPPIPGMEKAQLGPAAVEVSPDGTDPEMIRSLATRTSSEGWGAMIAYNVTAADSTAEVSALTEGLYGITAVRRA